MFSFQLGTFEVFLLRVEGGMGMREFVCQKETAARHWMGYCNKHLALGGFSVNPYVKISLISSTLGDIVVLFVVGMRLDSCYTNMMIRSGYE